MSVNDIRRTVTDDIFEVKQGDSDNNATFIFGNEDHTLGNALRHILVQRPETEFCGYSVPHPYDPKMNIRLQTREISSIVVLKQGLADLEDTADALRDALFTALQKIEK